jgi:hypothetical protein
MSKAGFRSRSTRSSMLKLMDPSSYAGAKVEEKVEGPAPGVNPIV